MRRQEVLIVLEADNPIFERLYRLSEMERALVQAQITELLDASLVELLRSDYASATMMPANKYILAIEWSDTCGDYCPINKCMHLDKYAMPLPEEIFDALGQAKVFSTLDLKSSSHQL